MPNGHGNEGRLMYKDKEKQKAANKAAAQRQRDKRKGMTVILGMTQGIVVGMTRDVRYIQPQSYNPMMAGYVAKPR